MITSQIKAMSTVERLRAMEELWDALCHEEGEMESPDWHKTIIDERRKIIDTGDAQFISIEDLKTDVRK